MATKSNRQKFPNALNYRRIRYQETTDKDMTQEKLAELTGFSQGKISKLESGAAELSFMDAKKIAQFIGVEDIRELFEIDYNRVDNKEAWVLSQYRAATNTIRDIVDKALEMVNSGSN